MLRWARSIDWVAIGATALILAAVLLVIPPQEQKKSSAEQATGQIAAPPSADERIADYTLGLEIFTALLALTGAAQIILLFRTDATARLSIEMQGLQNDTLIKQKEIQRIQLLALHRPRLIVREVYWDVKDVPTISFILVNSGVDPAVVKECRVEFNRPDERPILPAGENALQEMPMLPGGAAKIVSFDTSEYGITSAAFDMGLFESVTFQGVIIYKGEYGDAHYRLVFKRICSKGQHAFKRTDNPDDEYSD